MIGKIFIKGFSFFSLINLLFLFKEKITFNKEMQFFLLFFHSVFEFDAYLKAVYSDYYHYY
jgi:hypothetical protein